jgi:hypothetical protein
MKILKLNPTNENKKKPLFKAVEQVTPSGFKNGAMELWFMVRGVIITTPQSI